MRREKFIKRVVILHTEQQREIALAMVRNQPIGTQVCSSEIVKTRTPDQNSLMWSGPLKDISEQAWVDGQRFLENTWHEHFKEEFMPEECDPEIGRRVKNPETYRKWGITPKGERRCIASTTHLTVFGFSEYLEQIYAFGSGLGVMFSAGRIAA